MKLRKTLLVITSIVGAYSIARRYIKKKQPASVHPELNDPEQANPYLNFTPDQLKDEFKKRIAAGEWLSTDEYSQMMNAMRKNANA